MCEKGFSVPVSWKRQKLLHSVGATFTCEYCDYSAVQKGNIKTHQLKLHKDLLEQQESEEAYEKMRM